jgi:protoporphyrinogen oxidase
MAVSTAVDAVDFLVIGAGVSGLGFANAIREATRAGRAAPSVLVLEADAEPGGYCKTVERGGFTWDYSGHFFHFRHPDIEAWLRARMPGVELATVAKRALVRYRGRDVDFPFQKNIHQLDRDDFLDCLVDLYFRDEGVDPSRAPSSFKDMVVRRLGRGIAERFLIPYNEKLYACDLDELDAEAMGRFFPHVELADVIRNMRTPDNASYNSSFTYPRGGAIQYVRALLRDLPADAVALGEPAVAIDPAARTVTTPRRTIRYRHLISSAPLPRLLAMAQVAHDPAAFSWNQVLVFNLGFDRKGPADVHWMYFPDRTLTFYRVGFYDNILGEPRMSLYVEIGLRAGQAVDLEATRERVLADLRREGIVGEHRLLAWHSVTLDPAYVHITQTSQAIAASARAALAAHGVHSIGRYGGWTYCSIEDNLVEARALAAALAAAP